MTSCVCSSGGQAQLEHLHPLAESPWHTCVRLALPIEACNHKLRPSKSGTLKRMKTECLSACSWPRFSLAESFMFACRSINMILLYIVWLNGINRFFWSLRVTAFRGLVQNQSSGVPNVHFFCVFLGQCVLKVSSKLGHIFFSTFRYGFFPTKSQ